MDCKIDNQQVYAGIGKFDNDIGNGAIYAGDEDGKVITVIRPSIGILIARDFYKLDASKNGYGGGLGSLYIGGAMCLLSPQGLKNNRYKGLLLSLFFLFPV